MAGFNGSGVYVLRYNFTQDAANGIKILASRQDTQWNDMATGFGLCLTRDGQGYASANLPMGTFRHTGVGNGAALTDYLALGQLKTGAILYGGTAGGTVDALTAATSPVNTALTNGMIVLTKAAGANTITTPTFVLDSIGAALTITKNGGQALVVGDIFGAGHFLQLMYSSTGTRWELLNPATGGVGIVTLTGVQTLTNKTLTSPTITTPALGVATATSLNGLTITTSTGTLTISNGKTVAFSNGITFAGTDSTTMTFPGASSNIGYLEAPLAGGAVQTDNYTYVLTDSAKMGIMNASSKTLTIPANGSVAYPVGTVLLFHTIAAACTIAITSDTMHLASTGGTGSRTLAQWGIATAIKTASTTWVISGGGLT